MPVTIKVSKHEATLVRFGRGKEVQSDPQSIVKAVEPKTGMNQMIQTSFDRSGFPPGVVGNGNGFLQSIIDAYNNHHHVVIRPEDIWLAILTQLSFYVGAHAEELKSQFVAHKGRKKLTIWYNRETRFEVDFADFVIRINKLIEHNVIDPELRSWALPDFSTTTENDTIVASVVLMGTLQHYFRYECLTLCGIPSVRLLGDMSDYEAILKRLDKLEQYGEEPTLFAQLLRPVVKRLIQSFDEPGSPEVVDFWRNICAVKSESGSTTYNGWITAFCFWDKDGQVQFDSQSSLKGPGYLRRGCGKRHWEEVLCLDGLYYGIISNSQVPAGYVKMPVEIKDTEKEVVAEMLAGSIGYSCTSSGRKSHMYLPGLDTVQSLTGWFIYETKSNEPPKI